jgi:hypothetical protein
MIYNGKRKIKPTTTEYIDPLTLLIYDNTKPNTYPTQFLFDKNMNLVNTSNVPNNNYNEFMKMPSLLIPYTEILKLYNINNDSDIINYIKLNLETELFVSINRILNCWIRLNFTYLKKNHKILTNIYYTLFNHYFPSITSNENIFNKNCLNYLDKWFQKNNQYSFNLDLGNDLNNFLTK